MKATSTYKMPKPIKRVLSTILDKEYRNIVKREMIAADLSAKYAPRTPRNRKEGE